MGTAGIIFGIWSVSMLGYATYRKVVGKGGIDHRKNDVSLRVRKIKMKNEHLVNPKPLFK